ncbi:MAG TPA: TetR/AcrR family transcriptional regulator [Solirubrobacteraceae bacterium]|jgi:AcrR family transcriptional regulator
MPTKTAARPSVRERLLRAADELFYEEGVHVVGIDRVIERAGVSKASLYTNFGSKDELVRAYLDARHTDWRERVRTELARWDAPRERVLSIFDVLGASFTDPTFHGCAFANASAEARPGSPVVEAADAARAWKRALFEELVGATGARDPETLAQQLVQLYDGAQLGARMDRDPGTAAVARAAAAVLLDAATAA